MRTAYHYSSEDYCGPRYKTGTHFGTFEAAYDRWSSLALPGGCLVEVTLDIKLPFRTRDQGEWQEPFRLYSELVRSDDAVGEVLEEMGFDWPWDGNDWEKDEALLMAEDVLSRRGERGFSKAWEYVIDELIAQGYDGIVYENLVEDAGSLSYIIFYPDQVNVEAVALLPEDATPKELEEWWKDPPFEEPPLVFEQAHVPRPPPGLKAKLLR